MELGPFYYMLGPCNILQVYIDELNARRPPDTETILHKHRKRIATRGKNSETWGKWGKEGIYQIISQEGGKGYPWQSNKLQQSSFPWGLEAKR